MKTVGTVVAFGVLALLFASVCRAEESFYVGAGLFSARPKAEYEFAQSVDRLGPVGTGIALTQTEFGMKVKNVESGSPAAATGAISPEQIKETINGGKLHDSVSCCGAITSLLLFGCEQDENDDLSGLWSYGLTSMRTGEPLIEAGGEHNISQSQVSYGHNIVVASNGQELGPSGRPLEGGEKLVLTEDYQVEHNDREYARVVSLIAPIRDTILYNFEHTSKEEWLELNEVLRVNNIKTEDAPTITAQSILSIEQVYDYVASDPNDGNPVMRFLEEAELELKILGFVQFDFTNPEGHNYAEEHSIAAGSGIIMP